MRREFEEGILGRRRDVGQPVLGNADAEQILARQLGEERERRALWLRSRRLVEGQARRDLLDALSHLDDLDCAGLEATAANLNPTRTSRMADLWRSHPEPRAPEGRQ